MPVFRSSWVDSGLRGSYPRTFEVPVSGSEPWLWQA